MVVPQRTGVRIKGDNLYRVLNHAWQYIFTVFVKLPRGVPRVVESHFLNLTPATC